MTVLIVTLLLVGSLAVLAYPLFVQRRRGLVDEPAEELALGLRRARDRVYEEIRVLQQEYFLKSLSQKDYQGQLYAARLRAAALLAEAQQVQQTVETIDRTVEEEMRRAADEVPGRQRHKP